MYEGPIKAADLAGSEEVPILRQLRWTDLVARIAATRDCRPAGVPLSEEAHASFTAFHLDPTRGESGENGHQGINRDVLAHGKFSRVTSAEAANSAGNRDRETS